jgi:nucleoside-diphosphate-sugar epimerase
MVRRAVLVTGATGLIGRHLVPRLLAESASVRVVTRNPDRLPVEWRHLVETVIGDLSQPSVLVAATQGIELVYHLAAEIRDRSRMYAINVEVVRSLMDSAVCAGVTRFVHLSSVGVMGAVRPGVVTEAEPCRPRNAYERTKLQGEEVVRIFAQSGRIETAILRPTIVFGVRGEGEEDSFLGWLRVVKQGRFVLFGRRAIANYIYVGDVVEALVRLANAGVQCPAVYIAADSAPLEEFVEAMAKALGVASPTWRLPVGVAYVLGMIGELACWVLRTPALLTRARVRALSSETMFSGERMIRELGMEFPFGYRKGLDLTVEHYRAVGRL